MRSLRCLLFVYALLFAIRLYMYLFNPLIVNPVPAFERVNYVVHDLDATLEQLNPLWGPFSVKTVELGSVVVFGREARCSFKVAMSRDRIVAIYQPLDGESIFSRFLESNPLVALQSVSTMTSDIETPLAAFKANGYTEVWRAQLPNHGGRTVCVQASDIDDSIFCFREPEFESEMIHGMTEYVASSHQLSCSPPGHIDHIGHVVPSVLHSISWYKNIWDDMGNCPMPLPCTTNQGKNVPFMMLGAGFGHSGRMEMEYLSAPFGSSPHQEFLKKGFKGPHHVRMWAPQFEPLLDELKSRGWQTEYWQAGPFVRYVAPPTSPLIILEFGPADHWSTPIFHGFVWVWSFVCWPLLGR